MRAHHLAIRARDVQRVAAFYRDVLQLEVVTAPRPSVVWLRAGDLLLMIEPLDREGADASNHDSSSHDSATTQQGLYLLAFAIDPEARAIWERRLAEHNISIESRSDFTLYVRDPEGNRVGLSSYPNASA